MVAKVFIERKVRAGNERKVLELMKQLRVNCLDERGYVSGESLIDSGDSHTILVISTWWNKGMWDDWYASKKRMAVEKELEPLLQEPETVRVFMDGVPPEAAGP